MPPVYKVLIIGGGVIGLSLARQLRLRSVAVTVADPALARLPAQPAPGASYAAAGMLAVEDPGNPALLLPFSRLSRSLYDDFLAGIAAESGQSVPYQTHRTRQTMPDGSLRELPEQSLDPRQLTPALLSAVRRLGATLTPNTPPDAPFDAVVYTAGAWTQAHLLPDVPVVPRKGQMVRVALPPQLGIREVHRTEHVYIVPRLFGPQAGTALLGATVEDAGFDTTVTPHALRTLRSWAAALVPALADERLTPIVEAWAGLRPATPDDLPLLGELPPLPQQTSTTQPLQRAIAAATPSAPRRLIASGHYRNGILLAPATALLLADLLQSRAPDPSLQPTLAAFDPGRFTGT